MTTVSSYLGQKNIRRAFPGVKRAYKKLASKQRRALDSHVIAEWVNDQETDWCMWCWLKGRRQCRCR